MKLVTLTRDLLRPLPRPRRANVTLVNNIKTSNPNIRVICRFLIVLLINNTTQLMFFFLNRNTVYYYFVYSPERCITPMFLTGLTKLINCVSKFILQMR